MRTVRVELGDRAYPIHIGQGLVDRADLLSADGVLAGKSRALLVTNETVGPIYERRVVESLKSAGVAQVDVVRLPDGEQYKTVRDLEKVWDAAIEGRHGRDTTFVALGGGVVGDMCGFAAAAYQRGVSFVQVPTSLMACVDSSVGGKTGVNRPGGKNMVGAFHQPTAVIVDTATLDTLPARELASGIPEIVKYGLIRDAELFEWLESGGGVEGILARDEEALAFAVQRSCENKAAVVAADEREGGVRATLNLGHTFGHAIETSSGYGEWLHGEAVSAGTVMAAEMSCRLGWIDRELVERTTRLFERAGTPVAPPPGMTAAKFRELMAVDKKVKDGKLRLVLLKGELGGCVVTGDFDPKVLDETLEFFCDADKKR